MNNILKIQKKDLEITFYKSSGPGGQKKNKTESAVRIKHKPTGIIVTCDKFRHQSRNKKEAMRKLSGVLLAKNEEEQLVKRKALSEPFDKSRYNTRRRVRTYSAKTGVVRDIRLPKATTFFYDDVLHGDGLCGIIDELLKWQEDLELDYLRERNSRK